MEKLRVIHEVQTNRREAALMLAGANVREVAGYLGWPVAQAFLPVNQRLKSLCHRAPRPYSLP